MHGAFGTPFKVDRQSRKREVENGRTRWLVEHGVCTALVWRSGSPRLVSVRRGTVRTRVVEDLTRERLTRSW